MNLVTNESGRPVYQMGALSESIFEIDLKPLCHGYSIGYHDHSVPPALGSIGVDNRTPHVTRVMLC
jgi:hypothetical protein